MRLAVFGYGSLVSRESASLTLGREVPPPIPARLAGWRRRWSIYRVNTAHEKVFERGDGEPFEHVVGLNIERAPDTTADDWPNGVLVEVSEAELERLDLREKRYDRVEVTSDIRIERPQSRAEPASPGACDEGFDCIYAFTAKPAHFAAETPPNAIIIASYVAACETAFEELGPGQWDEFLATTGAFPAPVVEAHLVADSIPEGNPRDW